MILSWISFLCYKFCFWLLKLNFKWQLISKSFNSSKINFKTLSLSWLMVIQFVFLIENIWLARYCSASLESFKFLLVRNYLLMYLCSRLLHKFLDNRWNTSWKMFYSGISISLFFQYSRLITRDLTQLNWIRWDACLPSLTRTGTEESASMSCERRSPKSETVFLELAGAIMN